MKYYGYLMLTHATGMGQSGLALSREHVVKHLYGDKGERDKEAQKLALQNAGQSVILFETNSTIEINMRDIKFVNKTITDRGEVLPE